MTPRLATHLSRWSLHAFVYLVAATVLLPFVWMILTSLKSDSQALGAEQTFLPFPPRWSNYAEAIRAARLGEYYRNSLYVATVTTVLAVAHNSLAGYALSKLRFKGRKPLLVTIIATMMLPPAVFFVFSYVICARAGMIDNYQAMIIPYLASGFGVLYMKSNIDTVPDTLLEAGRLDGMSDLDLYWLIVRPIIWPAISSLAAISFVNAWNAFFWPLIVVDSDHMKTLPLAVADLASGQYVQSWPVRMAAASILTIPLMFVFVFCQRAFVSSAQSVELKE